jgi:hypothetical protein
MIGAFSLSDKPVVVNSGSFGGSNSTVEAHSHGNWQGCRFDQIVPLEKQKYIFVRRTDELERVFWFLTNLILLFISTE